MQNAQSVLPTPPAQPHRSEVMVRSLDHLVAMAQRYRREGRLRKARTPRTDYWSLRIFMKSTAITTRRGPSMSAFCNLFRTQRLDRPPSPLQIALSAQLLGLAA
jgi:hypothetical protein